jgi:hypothetical protein
VRRGPHPVCYPWRFARPRPLALLLVHLVERLAYDVVFGPLNRWAAHNILGLWYGGESCTGCLCVDVGRVFARVGALPCGRGVVLAAVVAVVAVAVAVEGSGGCVYEAGEGRSQDVAVCAGSLGALLLQGAHKGVGVCDGGMLEFLKSLQVAAALVALQLQQGDGGAQGNGVGVVALRDGQRRGLLAESGSWRGGDAGPHVGRKRC